MNACAVCFSGRIGSGKTTVSRELASHLHWPRVSFGDYVRAVAQQRGLDPASREVLAIVGEEIIETQGWNQFCRNVLNSASQNYGTGIVIDGIRHVEAIEHIGTILSPMSVFLVHLELVKSDVPSQRQKGKGLDPSGATEQHSTERQVVADLPRRADLVLSADLPVAELVTSVVDFLLTRSAAIDPSLLKQ